MLIGSWDDVGITAGCSNGQPPSAIPDLSGGSGCSDGGASLGLVETFQRIQCNFQERSLFWGHNKSTPDNVSPCFAVFLAFWCLGVWAKLTAFWRVHQRHIPCEISFNWTVHNLFLTGGWINGFFSNDNSFKSADFNPKNATKLHIFLLFCRLPGNSSTPTTLVVTTNYNSRVFYLRVWGQIVVGNWSWNVVVTYHWEST